MPKTKKTTSKNSKSKEKAENRARGKSNTPKSEKVNRKNGISIKSSQTKDWGEDFIFPVFKNHEKTGSQKNNKKNNKNKTVLSPHILDLRQGAQPETVFEKTTTPNQPAFNPDDWFSNFVNQPNESSAFKHQLDFELPEQLDEPTEKIKFYKPPKEKIKSAVKLNLSQDIIKTTGAKSKPPVVDLHPKKLNPFLTTIKKILVFCLRAITLPFRMLDFIVDRSLKGVWWLIKFIILSFINLFKSIFLNLKIILLGLGQRPVGIKELRLESASLRKFNYKPVLSFVIICFIIILPLQILNWRQKTNLIKGQVLGKSSLGFDYLKSASTLSQNLDFNQAEQRFNQAYFNFKLAHGYLENLDIFSQQIVKLVPQTSQADNLLVIGQISAQLGENLSALAQKLQSMGGSGETNGNSDDKLIQKLEAIEQTLNNIEPSFLELLERVKQIETEKLIKNVDDESLKKIILFQSSLPALKQNFDNLKTLNKFLLNFLGQKEGKKYLIIFQNNSELRPTGGFMGSYALLEVKRGKIIKMEIPGGGFYDLKAANQTIVEAPKPFHLFSPYWQIWNANWFPDWPTSAKKIVWFYENSLSGVTVDGIIAITPDVVEDLLNIIGPIEMPNYNKTITAENFVKEIQKAVEIEYDKEENQPKKIIADLMPVVLKKLFNLKTEQTPGFLRLLIDNLSKKNILLWFRQNEMQDVVQDFSWSGEIKKSQGDYLMVIHTNIGGGKTDRVIKNKILHNVEIDNQGNIFDTVILTRIHQGQKDDIFENKNNVDYVRFYVPAGSQLISAQGFDQIPSNLFKIAATSQGDTPPDPDLEKIEKNPILDERFNMRITNEFNKTCFGNWIMVKPGEEKTVTIKYKLPFKLEKPKNSLLNRLFNFIKLNQEETARYNLIVQKQPGLKSTDFTSQFNLPANWQVVNISQAKNELRKNNNTIIYQDDLKTDGYYGIEVK